MTTEPTYTRADMDAAIEFLKIVLAKHKISKVFLARLIYAARKRQMEEDCKAVCNDCLMHTPLVTTGYDYRTHDHSIDGATRWDCDAWQIRSKFARENQT